MEGAFTGVGNHLISDSAAAINAGADDFSALDPDENLLFDRFDPSGGRRRADDDDNQIEPYGDDENESLGSAPVDGVAGLNMRETEEPRELPPHACA